MFGTTRAGRVLVGSALLVGCNAEPGASAGATGGPGTTGSTGEPTTGSGGTSATTGSGSTGGATGSASTGTGETSASTGTGETSAMTGSGSTGSATTGSTGDATTGSTGGESTTESGSTGGTSTTTGVFEGCLEPTDSDTAGDPAAWSLAADPNGMIVNARSMAVDHTGAVIVTDRFFGELDLGGGPLVADDGYDRYFLAKFDGLGQHQWSLAYGGFEAGLYEQSIAVDCAGNVFVAGSFFGEISIGGVTLEAVPGFEQEADIIYATTDVFVAKFTPGGQLVWARRFGDTMYQRAHDVVATDSGGVVVAGALKGVLELDGTQVVADDRYDGLLAGFDGDGGYQWHKSFSAPADVVVFQIDRSASGLLSIGGAAASGVDFGGGPLAVEGNQFDYFAQFEPTGAHRWSRRGLAGYSWWDLAADPDGGVYVTGDVKMGKDLPTDAFLLRFDPAGTLAWGRYGGVDDFARSQAVAAGPNGDAVIVGRFRGTLELGGAPLKDPWWDNMFVGRFTAAGMHVSSQQFAGTGAEDPRVVRFGPDGEVVVAGRFEGTLDLGAGPMTAATNTDLFIHRFAP